MNLSIIMTVQLDLPRPEIPVEDFKEAWTHFELVAAAKDWNENKRKVILPTLLCGKLVDIYLTTDEETCGNLQHLKKALMHQAGLLRDPLTAGQSFMIRCQGPSESVNDFATDLKRLFVESYPDEEITLPILLQQFLTGLLPAIACQLLLNGKPTSLERAVADACDIEFALAFEPVQEEQQNVNVVNHKVPPATSDALKLQSFWNK